MSTPTVPRVRPRFLAPYRIGGWVGFVLGLAAWCGSDAGEGPCEALGLDEAREAAQLVVRARIVGLSHGQRDGVRNLSNGSVVEGAGGAIRIRERRRDRLDVRRILSPLRRRHDHVTSGRL